MAVSALGGLAATLCLGVGALGLIACTAPGPPTLSEPASQPKRGGTLSSNLRSDPFNWDPVLAGSSGGNQEGWSLAYEPLVALKTGPTVEYNDVQLIPGIAERWEISPDATSYTFHLRKGVRFANLPPVNGREVTAADVKWSLEYQARTGQFKDAKLPPGRFAQYFENLEQVDAPEAGRVVVRFSQPFAPFLSNAAEFGNPVMAREIYDRDGHLSDAMVGTGAFQLDTAAPQKGSRWAFKRNPTYWRSELPYLDEVRYVVISDESTINAAFKTRQLDVRPSATVGETLEQVRALFPDAPYYEYEVPGPMNIYMNVRRPPFSDERVRKALSLAIDRPELAKIANGGKAPYALSGVYPGFFTDAEVRQYVRHDPEQARRLLAEAGYADGLNLEHLYPSNSFGQAFVLEIQALEAQLRKVGINLTLKPLELPEYLSRTRGNTYDFTLRPLVAGIDVDTFLYGSFHPNSGRNYNGVNDPKLTTLLDVQRAEPDPAKRRERIREAARYIAEHAWGLVAHGTNGFVLTQPYVRDFRPHAGRRWLPVEATWLDR